MNIILVILRVVLVIIGFVLVIGSFCNLKEEKWERKPNKLIIAGLLCLCIFMGTLCISFIPANCVGVRWSIFNGTSENTLDEGIAFKGPLDKIYTISTTVQERTDKEVSVQTKDAQWVKMEVNVKYQVSKENAFKVYKGYKTLENLNKNIIGNYAQEELNKVCSEYNVIDILGEKRNEVVTRATDSLKEKFLEEGINLKALTIKDVDAGEAIEKAIEDEAIAKKAVETAKQNQEKAKTEAETKLIEAEGEAQANAVKTKELTKEILMEQWIKKWNGELPKVASEDGVMIDLNELTK
ncbi:MAG: prohibitin family protein [Massilimicrobiota timonensis]